MSSDGLLGGRYRLLSLIGSGASAKVYRANDTTLGREVAVKILHPGLAADGPFRRRFETEARHAAALNHPNLLAIYDWDDSNRVYIVTELLAGGSLREILDSGPPLTISQALLVGLEASQGLAHAHDEGFVHRDIKPANLLFNSAGRLSVADFGIARAVAEASWTEPEGALIGTARYAAPEQALGRGVDGRADVYALALTLIEAVTGEVPLVGSSPLATMVLRQDHDVDPSDALGALRPAIAHAGLANSEDRATARTFIAELEQAASQLPRPAPLVLVPLSVQSVGDQVLELAETDVIELGETEVTKLAGIHGGANPHDKPGRGWVWPLVALLALVAAIIAVLVGSGEVNDILSDPVPEVITYPVGTYVGRDVSEAEIEIARNDWTSEVSFTRSDGSVPGEVLTQTPAAGVQLAEGGVVILVASDGPLLHATPELTGLTRAEAELELEAENLELGNIEREFSEEVASGIVLASSPAAGTEIETGSVVDLVLSAGPEPRVLDDLSGRTQAEAEAVLVAAGLVPLIAEDFSQSVPEGIVISTDPVAGSTVDRGAEVTIVVSIGLPFVVVPDVVGMSAADAADVLTSAGLVVTDTDGPPNKDVLATDPPAGESVRQGTGVIIFTRR